MKKVVSLALVCLFVVTMLASCGAGDSVVGTWSVEEEGISYSYTFNEDGTGKIAAGEISLDFTWEAKDGKLSLETMGQTTTLDYSIKGNTMTIIGADGTENVMTKQ